MTFTLKKKMSSRTIRSPRRRGTPGATRTHYIPLRRRTLYPGEVRGRMRCYCTAKAGGCQRPVTLPAGLPALWKIRPCQPADDTGQGKERNEVRNCHQTVERIGKVPHKIDRLRSADDNSEHK